MVIMISEYVWERDVLMTYGICLVYDYALSICAQQGPCLLSQYPQLRIISHGIEKQIWSSLVSQKIYLYLYTVALVLGPMEQIYCDPAGLINLLSECRMHCSSDQWWIQFPYWLKKN